MKKNKKKAEYIKLIKKIHQEMCEIMGLDPKKIGFSIAMAKK